MSSLRLALKLSLEASQSQPSPSKLKIPALDNFNSDGTQKKVEQKKNRPSVAYSSSPISVSSVSNTSNALDINLEEKRDVRAKRKLVDSSTDEEVAVGGCSLRLAVKKSLLDLEDSQLKNNQTVRPNSVTINNDNTTRAAPSFLFTPHRLNNNGGVVKPPKGGEVKPEKIVKQNIIQTKVQAVQSTAVRQLLSDSNPPLAKSNQANAKPLPMKSSLHIQIAATSRNGVTTPNHTNPTRLSSTTPRMVSDDRPHKSMKPQVVHKPGVTLVTDKSKVPSHAPSAANVTPTTNSRPNAVHKQPNSTTPDNSHPRIQKVRKKKTKPSAVPIPILYVGITMERTEVVKSWGLVFTKEKSGHAHIVRVVGPPKNSEAERPTVNWCQITRIPPSSTTVYRTSTTSSYTPHQFESHIQQHFPPQCTEKRWQDTGLLKPQLNPGDAIISINGLPVSAFPNTSSFANYIRANCQRKMVMVAIRHERVWAAALEQILAPPPPPPPQPIAVLGETQPMMAQGASVNNAQAMTDRISKAVGQEWKMILVPSSHHQGAKRKAPSHPAAMKRPKIAYTNSMFKDANGNPIQYCDNNDEDDPDEGKRIQGFVTEEIEVSFHSWLTKRKAVWRERRPRKYISLPTEQKKKVHKEDDVLTVQHDFWSSYGYESFDTWLSASKSKWSRSYSWHKEKKSAIKSECEREVNFPTMAPTDENHNVVMSQFGDWLGVRKQQWRLERRKRHRHRIEMPIGVSSDNETKAMPTDGPSSVDCATNDTNPSAAVSNNAQSNYFDEILEDAERITKEEEDSRQPMDISWIFNSQLGAPDDAILNIMGFLCPSDHGNLLCLSYTTNFLFKQRNVMWRSLCPTHWVLPRRPRKSWCVMYITKIRAEEEASRKRSDDLLLKLNVIIEKGDQLNKIEKLIKKAQKDFEFSVNYTSGVVIERNSLLNLAVIDKRHKITKWLIEEKAADIESCDRGQFTPLLNAAWNGDKYIVRYLLAKGCDRTKIGYNHSSQGLAPSTFEGLTAEGWARKQGHNEVAELIRLGL